MTEKSFEPMKVEYFDTVLKYTYPIFIQKHKDDKPELVGSSIVIFLEGKFYLVTAAHVPSKHIKQNKSFYIATEEGQIVAVDGQLISSSIEDDFDIGFIELDKYFIEKNKIEAFFINDESIAGNNTEKYLGLLCGYPVSANMNHNKKAWRKDPQNYRGRPYGYFNIILAEKEDENIVMLYGKNNNGEQPKKLNGMSGGGMWAYYISTEKLQLAGIFIRHKRREKTLHAIPIHEVIAFIQKYKAL